jgi:WD40 repeat protein
LEEDFVEAGLALRRSARRARRRRLALAFGALIVALVVIGASALVALRQKNVATSRQLAAEAKEALNVDPALSLTLALRALGGAHTTQADEVLRQATAQSHGLSLITADGGAIYSMRLLPGDRQAVSGSEDGAVRLWNVADGTLQARFPLHRKAVYAVRVAPDGRAVASGGRDGDLRMTDMASGDSRVILNAPTGVMNIEFSHAGNLLAAPLGDGTVHVLDPATGQEKTSIRTGQRSVYAAAFSADDSMLATGNADGTVQIWRLPDGALLRVLHSNDVVWTVQFSPSASHLLTAGNDGLVRIWDAETGANLRELKGSGLPVNIARFSPDGKRIAAAGQDGRIYIWDEQGLALATLRGHNDGVLDVDFDHTGHVLASAGSDGTIRTWAVEDELRLRTPVTTAVFDPDGTRIVSGAPDGRLRVWRRADLATLLDIPDHDQRSQAVFSSDGSKIVSYSDDGRVNVRAAVDGTLQEHFDPHVGRIRTVAPDPTDQRLAIGGENGRLSVVFYGGAAVETLSETGSPVNTTSFSPDGRSVLAGRADGSLELWGPDRHQVTIKPVDYKPVYKAVFGRGGSAIASADSSGSVNVWDVHGHTVAVLRGHEGLASAVHFRGDTGQLVSSGADGTVRVWDVDTQALLMSFENTDGFASYVDVTRDGSTILKSAENGQALRLLSCAVCEPLDFVIGLARSHAFRALTEDEERRFVAPG